MLFLPPVFVAECIYLWFITLHWLHICILALQSQISILLQASVELYECKLVLCVCRFYSMNLWFMKIFLLDFKKIVTYNCMFRPCFVFFISPKTTDGDVEESVFEAQPRPSSGESSRVPQWVIVWREMTASIKVQQSHNFWVILSKDLNEVTQWFTSETSLIVTFCNW